MADDRGHTRLHKFAGSGNRLVRVAVVIDRQQLYLLPRVHRRPRSARRPSVPCLAAAARQARPQRRSVRPARRSKSLRARARRCQTPLRAQRSDVGRNRFIGLSLPDASRAKVPYHSSSERRQDREVGGPSSPPPSGSSRSVGFGKVGFGVTSGRQIKRRAQCFPLGDRRGPFSDILVSPPITSVL